MPKTFSDFNVTFFVPDEPELRFPFATRSYNFSPGERVEVHTFDFDKMDYEKIDEFEVIRVRHVVYGVGELADINTVVELKRIKDESDSKTKH